MKIILKKLAISIVFSLLSLPLFAAAISDPVIGELQNHLNLAKKASLKQKNLIALDHLRLAISLARDNGYVDSELTALIETVDIHQGMGQGMLVDNSLRRISEIVALDDGAVMARGHGFLARYFLQHGELEKARESLHVAVDAYRFLGDNPRLAESLLDLGFSDIEVAEYELAEKAFDEAFNVAKKSNYKFLAAIAALNLAKVKQHRSPRLNVNRLLTYVDKNIRSSADSAKRLELSISLARFYRDQSRRPGIVVRDANNYRKRAYTIYRTVSRLAKQQGKVRVASYAQGGIGRLYSDEGRYAEAALYFDAASLLAHESNSLDSYYRWDVELALAKGKGKDSDALSYFRVAMKILDKAINTILDSEPDAYQNLLREYFEQYLAAIARQDRASHDSRENDESLAREAYHVMDTLKLSEVLSHHTLRPMETLFPNEHEKGRVDYLSVVTKEALYIVVNDQKRIYFKLVDVGGAELNRQIVALRKAIDKERDISDLSASLYRYLISPIASSITAGNKLRFSHDGLLRALPMAVLHDGEKYLIEKYTIEYFVSNKLHDYQWEREDELLAGRNEQWSNLNFSYSHQLIGIRSRILIDSSRPQGSAGNPGYFSFEGDLVEEVRKNNIRSLVVADSQWSSDEISQLLVPLRLGVKNFVSTLWYGDRMSMVITDNMHSLGGQFSVDERIQQIQISLLKMKVAPKYWSSAMVVGL